MCNLDPRCSVKGSQVNSEDQCNNFLHDKCRDCNWGCRREKIERYIENHRLKGIDRPVFSKMTNLVPSFFMFEPSFKFEIKLHRNFHQDLMNRITFFYLC